MCAASSSCMRFLYSIFLVIVVSLFAEGWERPSVSGTHPLSHCHSVPCVPCLTPPTATSMPLWLMGCSRPPGRCPLTASLQQPLPADAASWEGHVHACVAPMTDSCILQGYDLASSGASVVTGRVAVPESLETAGLLT